MNEHPSDFLNLPTPMTDKQLKAYLIGQALKGAYSNPDLKMDRSKLVSHIGFVVNRLMNTL